MEEEARVGDEGVNGKEQSGQVVSGLSGSIKGRIKGGKSRSGTPGKRKASEDSEGPRKR